MLLGIGWNFGFIGATTMVTECHRPNERNRVQSFNDFLVFGSMAIGSFSSGTLLNHFGWSAVNDVVFPVVLSAAALLLWGTLRQRASETRRIRSQILRRRYLPGAAVAFSGRFWLYPARFEAGWGSRQAACCRASFPELFSAGQPVQSRKGSNSMTALWLIVLCGALAIVYAIWATSSVMKSDAGSARMQEIAAAVAEGAQAYLKRQYATIGIVGIVIFLIVGYFLGWLVATGFAIGAILSGVAGFIGMNVSVRANVRTAQAAIGSLAGGLELAFKAGAITGMLVAGSRAARRHALFRLPGRHQGHGAE